MKAHTLCLEHMCMHTKNEEAKISLRVWILSPNKGPNYVLFPFDYDTVSRLRYMGQHLFDTINKEL